jgi:hypothetical protein
MSVMDNPLGGIKRGWVEISDVYRRLFASPKPYRFEFYDYTLHRYGEVCLAIGRERGGWRLGTANNSSLPSVPRGFFVGRMPAGGRFTITALLKMPRCYRAIRGSS